MSLAHRADGAVRDCAEFIDAEQAQFSVAMVRAASCVGSPKEAPAVTAAPLLFPRYLLIGVSVTSGHRIRGPPAGGSSYKAEFYV